MHSESRIQTVAGVTGKISTDNSYFSIKQINLVRGPSHLSGSSLRIWFLLLAKREQAKNRERAACMDDKLFVWMGLHPSWPRAP